MNDCPGYQLAGPPNANQPATAFAQLWGTPPNVGHFYKQVQWTDAAERALVADSLFWIDECEIPPFAASYPPAVSQTGQSAAGDNATYNASDQTLVDIYRHGVKPGVKNPGTTNAQYNPISGSVGYNILYCDGHVSEVNDAKEAYKSYRMRFPN